MRIRQTIVALATITVFATIAAAEQPAASSESEAPSSTTTSSRATTSDAPSAPTLLLAGVAVCKGVEKREPVGDAESFRSDVGTLWCYTDVRNAEEPTQIFHRWYVGEKMVNEIPIQVDGPRWRCWSQKTIPSSWSGDCRVEIVTEDGEVLGTESFHLEAAEGSSMGSSAESAG
jgi:hypothetical protein